ncbi:MAG TPA: sigma 54-interacting transcriptional regulator, partial [Polyangium sp.]|nr:sigma 54-interacting transcriptional regulator [Polyangium sp.]
MSNDSSSHRLSPLVIGLRDAKSFEDAAKALLETMRERASRALSANTAIRNARLMRAVVHLRPPEGYQRIFGIEGATGAEIEGTGYVSSSTLWHWIVEHRAPVSVDVVVGLTHVHQSEGQGGENPSLLADVALGPGSRTRELLLEREASHVHVVPLRAPGGHVFGLVTLEARCRGATGIPTIWESCREALELFANVAAPYIGTLPPRAITSPATDALLPVVGRMTAGLIEVMRVFAAQEETVLISGPTGVGKSRLARWCHEQSPRKGRRFETLDLSTVPENLQMAELFGWKRGAFTGAVKDSMGAMGRAADGTLFIDEIQNLSPKAQVGLLRVLEERRYRAIGDETGERRADVRFIIGTNEDLRAAVASGKLREDLYYRINVLPVRLPPLSEREDEIPLWAEYMLARRHAESNVQSSVRLDPEAATLLAKLPWPGNLRQLDNIIRRAYVMALAELRGTNDVLLLTRAHFDRALAYDRDPTRLPLLTQLWQVAKRFVEEAERREENHGPKLTLDMIESIQGMALAAAVARVGGRDEAFRLLGQEQLRLGQASRNRTG